MSEMKDLVGKPLAVGDIVAYPTSVSSSSYMCVARIEEVIEREVERHRYSRDHGEYITVMVTDRKVKVQPLYFNDYRGTKSYDYDAEGNLTITAKAPKPVFITRVKNFVKVELPDGK